MFHPLILDIIENLKKDSVCGVSRRDACELAGLGREHTLDLIFCAAKVRELFKKNKVFTCSLVNAKSGKCSQDCAFCAQSSYHETGAVTYPFLSEEQIIDHALKMRKAGAVKFSMVTSGYMLNDMEIDRVCRSAAAIRKKSGLEVCGSLGMLIVSTAKKLLENGVTTYHHNLETARSFFGEICTTHDYEEDIQSIELAKSADLKICSGGILGLGESWDQRVELAFTLKELDVDCIPLNFLNPISGTRLEGMPLMEPLDALKSVALFRLINPEKDITICGGREVTIGNYQSWLFMAGANGLMIGNYLTTTGRSPEDDINMIQHMGLVPDYY
jgi:biotin synthase